MINIFIYFIMLATFLASFPTIIGHYRNKFSGFFAYILIFLLLLGYIITITGINEYGRLNIKIEEPPENAQKIFFFGSHKIFENITDFQGMFLINEVEDPDVEVQFTFKIKLKEETDAFYFGMQIPYSLREEPKLGASYGPEIQIIEYVKCGNNSYFCSKFIFENPAPRNENIRITIKFNWEDCFFRKTYSKYQFIIPFSVESTNLCKEGIGECTQQLFTIKNILNGTLSVNFPSSSSASLVLPEPNFFTFEYGRFWIFWDVKEKENRFLGSEAFLIDIVLNNFQQEEAFIKFYSGILIALGASIMVTTALEGLRKLSR